ncbi:hypothetical protein [Pseudoalteromonas sp. PB2-1]|uniref:hypothetical protein n=1 Tax=Pseudoalteromonas sp. PB2-1 TaxID=2907242 RepID=UPI003703D8F1|tara:strand:+ start:10404 stop:10673 length:270 start_codon:yes stop_codon:yes gene_type:complete
MAKHKKFQITLVVLVVCIMGFNLIDIRVDFFLNPFYILSLVTAIILVVQSINYTCPKCGKNQVIRSFLKYNMPKESCYSCASQLDKNDK